jgi:anti-sigma B factor antagonist
MAPGGGNDRVTVRVFAEEHPLTDRFIPPRFECLVEPDRDQVVVRPQGELDMATVPQVDEQVRELVESGFKKVVIDLGSLTFLDSTGIRMLLQWTATADTDGIDFALLPGTGAVERVLDITGVRQHFHFIDPAQLRHS